MSILLSNRQHPMMQVFMDGGEGYYMSVEDAALYDQRPFRSMLIRKWISYRPGRGFHATREGREAWRDYHGTEIFRKNPMLPLTSYFDFTAYGLHVPIRKAVAKKVGSVREMLDGGSRRGAA